MDAQYAYSIFGLATMAIGGLATGLAMSSFFNFTKTKKHILILVPAFFVAIVMTGLGFNTLDFMLGSFYWTNMTYPPPVQVALIRTSRRMELLLLLLRSSTLVQRLLDGISNSLLHIHLQTTTCSRSIRGKEKLGCNDTSNSPQKEYVAESKVFWRNRSVIRETFENTN